MNHKFTINNVKTCAYSTISFQVAKIHIFLSTTRFQEESATCIDHNEIEMC